MNELKKHLEDLLKNKETNKNPFLSDDNGYSTYYDKNTKDPIEYDDNDNFWDEE